MSALFWTVVSCLCKTLLSLRYRIEVKGLETLTPEKLNRKGGILFLPNHPAHMDPFFNFLILWPKFRMRPLVIEYIFNLSFLRPVFRLIKALPVPNFESGVNEYKRKRGEKSIGEIVRGIQEGEHFMVYPSGRLKSTGKELIGGASGVHEILKECPDANVVLIRTTGLWGSSFSRAFLGRSPPLAFTLVHGMKVLLKNLFFFTPRRHVMIEMETNPEEMPREKASRIDLNRFLENWYNRYPDASGIRESEPLTLVSYSIWREELPEVYRPAKRMNGTGAHVSDDTRRKIYNEIKKIVDRSDLEVKPEMNLAFDLGMDSLNIAELITFLTKNFDVAELHPEDLETVGTVLEIAEGGEQAPLSKEPPPDFTWIAEVNRPAPMLPMGRTIPEAFLNSCQRMKNSQACGDDLIGVVGYKRLKKGALVLAQYFKTCEEDRIAIMLPASLGAYITILAILLAGKTPVMLNWTLGARYLEEMMRISKAQRIITSWKFLDRLANVQFGSCLDQLILLEDIRKKLTLSMKLRGLFLAKCSVDGALKRMRLNLVDENAPCIILFTSGTEAAPKGVPLSHKNIISNQRSAMQCIDLRAEDVVYGILPPFHSFGFSVAGLFPILGGIRVAYYPDPTDSFALAEGVRRWKITLFCSAPSFIKGLFYAAKPEDLKSIRYFVSGAEKAPAELFDRVAQTGAKLLEGYGITECSPILTLNRPNMPPKGVGRLAPDIELITIHPETLAQLPEGIDGEICVRGPNIFSGYLENPRTPFIEIDGKRWYRTGDLGHLEPDGSLILSGRLKRFTKIGGEMISLGGVEEVIVKHLINIKRISPDVPSVALIADEKEEGKPRLILFAAMDLGKDEANQILQEAGFSNLIKIAEVRKIEEIPIMGTGKTDYRTLQGLC